MRGELAAVVAPASRIGRLRGGAAVHAGGVGAHAALVVVGVGAVRLELEALHARGAAPVVSGELGQVAPLADELLAGAGRRLARLAGRFRGLLRLSGIGGLAAARQGGDAAEVAAGDFELAAV